MELKFQSWYSNLGRRYGGLNPRLSDRKENKDLIIQILDKEIELGAHNSVRNSGVLYEGIYYKPDSLKAKVCTQKNFFFIKWTF